MNCHDGIFDMDIYKESCTGGTFIKIATLTDYNIKLHNNQMYRCGIDKHCIRKINIAILYRQYELDGEKDRNTRTYTEQRVSRGGITYMFSKEIPIYDYEIQGTEEYGIRNWKFKK